MEKFVDKKIVRVLDIASVIFGILWVVTILGSMIMGTFGMFYVWFPSMIIFIVSSVWSWLTSNKAKYTRKFMEHVRRRIDEAYTIDDFTALRQEFESLCIKDGTYTLSFPFDIKALHMEIVSKLEVLQKNKRGGDSFSLGHVVLYSKGWYAQGDLWTDMVRLLEADGYVGTFEGDTQGQVRGRVAYLLVMQLSRVELRGNSGTLLDFYEAIKDHNCWKYGYFTHTNSGRRWGITTADHEFNDYDYDEAVVRYCLSIFRELDRGQWNSSIEPDYNVLNKK